MPQINVMTWNLGDLTIQRLQTVDYPFVEFMAQVMMTNQISLLGLCGIRDSLANTLGQALVNNLYNRTRTQNINWNYQASPPLGAGWDEQYMFVWNLSALTAVPMPQGSGTYWYWDYPLPGNQQGVYGFPRPTATSVDMPPFTMFFQLNPTTKVMCTSILHAPSWLLPPNNVGAGIAQALNNIAQIPNFTWGQAGLLMGTFNVPPDDNVATPNSNGAGAFNGLTGQGGHYAQVVNNQRNLLTDNVTVAIPMEEALNLTADNFFFRTDGPNNGVTTGNAGIVNILTESIATLDVNFNYIPAPLGPALATAEMSANLRTNGQATTTALEDGSYGKLDDALEVYHDYISNYLPLAVTINY